MATVTEKIETLRLRIAGLVIELDRSSCQWNYIDGRHCIPAPGHIGHVDTVDLSKVGPPEVLEEEDIRSQGESQ